MYFVATTFIEDICVCWHMSSRFAPLFAICYFCKEYITAVLSPFFPGQLDSIDGANLLSQKPHNFASPSAMTNPCNLLLPTSGGSTAVKSVPLHCTCSPMDCTIYCADMSTFVQPSLWYIVGASRLNRPSIKNDRACSLLEYNYCSATCL